MQERKRSKGDRVKGVEKVLNRWQCRIGVKGGKGVLVAAIVVEVVMMALWFGMRPGN